VAASLMLLLAVNAVSGEAPGLLRGSQLVLVAASRQPLTGSGLTGTDLECAPRVSRIDEWFAPRLAVAVFTFRGEPPADASDCLSDMPAFDQPAFDVSPTCLPPTPSAVVATSAQLVADAVSSDSILSMPTLMPTLLACGTATGLGISSANESLGHTTSLITACNESQTQTQTHPVSSPRIRLVITSSVTPIHSEVTRYGKEHEGNRPDGVAKIPTIFAVGGLCLQNLAKYLGERAEAELSLDIGDCKVYLRVCGQTTGRICNPDDTSALLISEVDENLFDDDSICCILRSGLLGMAVLLGIVIAAVCVWPKRSAGGSKIAASTRRVCRIPVTLVAAMTWLTLCTPLVGGAKPKDWLTGNTLSRGTRPSARSGYGLAYVDNLAILFGGAVSGKPSDSVHVLSPKSIAWSDITAVISGPKPLARINMGFSGSLNGIIYMFGGIGIAGSEPMNDLWTLDSRNLKWSELSIAGAPSARYSMGFITISGGNLLLYGGSRIVNGEVVASSVLMLFDVQAYAWTTIEPASSSTPGARYDMGFAMGPDVDTVILLGGRLSPFTGESQYSWKSFGSLDSDYSADKSSDDLWEFNLVSKKWKKRIPSLYGELCSADPVANSAEDTFCNEYVGLGGIALTSTPGGYIWMLGGNSGFSVDTSAASADGGDESGAGISGGYGGYGGYYGGGYYGGYGGYGGMGYGGYGGYGGMSYGGERETEREEGKGQKESTPGQSLHNIMCKLFA